MNKPKTATGIVGFFDILGYANFLENNDPEEAAEIVINALLNLGDSLTKYHDELFPEEDLKTSRDIFSKINSLVFSDTILLTLPYPENAEPDAKRLYWAIFMLNSVLLYRHLFDVGLPLRGALTCGKFLVHETCFAGRNIIEAYKLAQQLDLSAVVLAKSAMSELHDIEFGSSITSFMEVICPTYLIPLKGGKSDHHLTLAPSLFNFPTPLPTDIRQYIASTFWKHKKDLRPEEINKIDNTELLFRYFKMKEPRLFNDSAVHQQNRV